MLSCDSLTALSFANTASSLYAMVACPSGGGVKWAARGLGTKVEQEPIGS
jgi:hypothetical protein